MENTNKRYELIKVDSVSDLGVRFDSNLAFLLFLYHMNEEVNKAYRMLGIIKRNYIYFHNILLFCCKAMVRPHLE